MSNSLDCFSKSDSCFSSEGNAITSAGPPILKEVCLDKGSSKHNFTWGKAVEIACCKGVNSVINASGCMIVYSIAYPAIDCNYYKVKFV
jgi:hypothetical protein